jgi:hypothetical protein
MPIDIIIPPDQLQKLTDRLSPRQLHQATYQVVKRTTAQVVRLIRKEVREQVTIDKKYVDRVITQVNPQGDPPVGQVIIKKQPVPLIAFFSARGIFQPKDRTPASSISMASRC